MLQQYLKTICFLCIYTSLHSQSEPYTIFNSRFYPNKGLRLDFTISQYVGKSPVVSIHQYNEVADFYGNRTTLIDTNDLGNYRLVINSPKGIIYYLVGFSSPLEEAVLMQKLVDKKVSFQHSLLLPFPKQNCYITIQKRDTGNKFSTILEKKFQPIGNHIKKVNQTELGASSLWLGSTDFSSQIDIVVVSDGYANDEMLDFVSDTRELFNAVFEKEPLREYKHMFNVMMVELPKNHNGNVFHHGFFTSSNFLEIERYLTIDSIWSLHNYLNNVPYEHIVVLRKAEQYEGAGVYNHYTIVSAKNPLAADVLIHEFGHAIFGLADEYVDEQSPLQKYYDSIQEPWEPNISKALGSTNKWLLSPSIIAYNKLMDSLALDIDKVSIYEGAGYKSKGIYRPYPYCTMRDSKKTFCPVCQDAIRKQILFKCNIEKVM